MSLSEIVIYLAADGVHYQRCLEHVPEDGPRRMVQVVQRFKGRRDRCFMCHWQRTRVRKAEKVSR